MAQHDASAELTRRFEETRRRNIGYRVTAATELREAVKTFDAQEHLTWQTISALRMAMLAVAEELYPLPESARVPGHLLMAVRPGGQS